MSKQRREAHKINGRKIAETTHSSIDGTQSFHSCARPEIARRTARCGDRCAVMGETP